MTSGQIQGLPQQQQQQLQQLYLQHQAQAQVQIQQQQGMVLNSTTATSQGLLDNTKNVANHVTFQGTKGENHEHLNASQVTQQSVPGSSLQNNWPETAHVQSDQNGLSVIGHNSEVQASISCMTTRTISNSETPSLPTQPHSETLSQSDSLLTKTYSDSTVTAMETSIAGHCLLQMSGHQNSEARPETETQLPLSSKFVSTSSNELLTQSIVSCQGTNFLSSGTVTTGLTMTSGPPLRSGMDSTILSEINFSTDAKSSPLTGNGDPTLSNGPISSYSGFSSASGMSISPFSSPSYVMSPTQKSPFHATASLSPSISQPLSIINPTCLSPSSGLQGTQSAFSPSLIPTDLLSPSKQLAVVSPGSSKSPFSLSVGGDNLAVPKLNLLLDSTAIPHPPPTPTPPLPTDRLSPQTPSIHVSTVLLLKLEVYMEYSCR